MSFAVIEARTRYATGSRSLNAAKKAVRDLLAAKDTLVQEFVNGGSSDEEAEALFKNRYDEALALQKHWQDEARAAFADLQEIDPRNDNTFSR